MKHRLSRKKIISVKIRVNPWLIWKIDTVKVHHIGVVVKKVSDSAKYYSEVFGYRIVSKVVIDAKQKSRLLFIRLGENLLELIEPTGEDSPVYQFLRKGGGLHHLCYLVDDLEGEIQRFRDLGALIVCPPTPAVAFDGRRIAFIYTTKRELVELLEKKEE